MNSFLPSIADIMTAPPLRARASLLENARRAFKRVKGKRVKGGQVRRDKIIMGFRCTSGPRKNRMVSNPGQCFRPINVQKRFAMKKRLARFAKKYAFRARKTKRTNATSKRLAALNKALRR